VDWARSLDFGEVVALVRPENAASRRVAEKAGLREAGETMHAGLEHLVYRLELRIPPGAEHLGPSDNVR
jgi:RimJ/RimL family protein N-acetyltransferase